MRFESEQKRNLWIAYGARVALEYVIIYLFLKMFASEWDKGDKFGEAFIGLFILWGVEIALSIKNAIIGYAIYKWKGKQETVENLLAAFKKFNLPKPNEYYDDAYSYIDDVLNDEDASQEAKNYVSVITGVLTTFKSNHMLMRAGFYQTSLEEAIKQYRKTFKD